MAQLTKEKQELLTRLNQEADAAHVAATDKAIRDGRPLPTRPKPLEAEDIEYPKFLYNSAGQSKLVHDASEHKNLGSGWAEEPPKQDAPKKQEPPKKE